METCVRYTPIPENQVGHYGNFGLKARKNHMVFPVMGQCQEHKAANFVPEMPAGLASIHLHAFAYIEVTSVRGCLDSNNLLHYPADQVGLGKV